MERYFSHTPEVEFTDRLLESCMLTVLKEAKRAMLDPGNYDARANLMWCGTIAHNNVTGVGRAQDWGTHHMENELSTHYGCSRRSRSCNSDSILDEIRTEDTGN